LQSVNEKINNLKKQRITTIKDKIKDISNSVEVNEETRL